jgi:PAS domain S-box-containing protein
LQKARDFLKTIVDKKDLELEKSLHRNNFILNSTEEEIIGLDNQGLTTFINPSGAEMLGYHSDDLIGHPLFEFIIPKSLDENPFPPENSKSKKK